MSLGRRVRYYREKLGLTLDKLSEMSGVEVGTISALELRDSQRSKFAPALAAAFRLTVEQLIDESRDWLDVAVQHGSQAASNVVVVNANEPAKLDYSWPFGGIDPEKVRRLDARSIQQIEGAMLLVSAQLGLDIKRRAAA